MCAIHGNLVDADASGAKASTKHIESRSEIILLGSIKQFFHKSAFQPFVVIHFSSNRKCICDFLIPISPSVTLVLSCTISEIFQVFVLMSPPLFHPNFGMFPLDQVASVGVSVSRYLKVFGREIIFEVL